MYKDNKDKVENKDEANNEKVIIRIKRKIEDRTIPSIYIKKANRNICDGMFYKYIDTQSIESENFQQNIIYLCSDYNDIQKNNKSIYKSKSEVLTNKRKFNSLKNCEEDLKGAFRNLKKYKIIKQNVHYVDSDEINGNIKIIDMDLVKSITDNSIDHVSCKQNKNEEYNDEHNYEYDFYILDNEKLYFGNQMDHLYNIKFNNIDSLELIVLEDTYGNNANEYDTNSYTSSCDSNSQKEMSDYPDENEYSEVCDGRSNFSVGDNYSNFSVDIDEYNYIDDHGIIPYINEFNDSNCSDDCYQIIPGKHKQKYIVDYESYVDKNNSTE